jgi:hypothetical protein
MIRQKHNKKIRLKLFTELFLLEIKWETVDAKNSNTEF